MKNPIKMDDLGVPLFLETPIYNWEEHFDWLKCLVNGYFVSQMNKKKIRQPQALDVISLEVQVDYFLNGFSVKTIVLVGIYFINISRGRTSFYGRLDF